MNKFSKVAAIVLAAGKGIRMQSDLPKVLHTIDDKPIVHHTLTKLLKLKLGTIILVVGHREDLVRANINLPISFISQPNQLGTGHAVLQALPTLPNNIDTVLVVNGDDSAFYKKETLKAILNKHFKSKTKMTLLTIVQEGAEVAGRVVRDNQGKVTGIKPKSQMTEYDYKHNHELVCGLYIFNRSWLENELPKVEQDKKGEYNITGLIKTAVKQSSVQDIILSDNNEWRSINTQAELEKARKLWKQLH